jgi:shikimate kinase
LLRVADPLAKLKELFLERDPLYRQVADLVVEAREGGAAALALAIEAKLSS